MRKRFTIPSLVAIILLLVSIGVGVLLVKKKQFFKVGAGGNPNPENIKMTNISDSSFSVSWATDKESLGFIEWGKNSDLGKVIPEEGKSKLIHLVTIKNLKPETVYFFKINSGSKLFDNDGKAWQVETGPVLNLNTTTQVSSGIIISQTNIPLEGVLVYISSSNSPGISPLATLTNKKGEWVIPLSQARTTDLSSYNKLEVGSSLEIFVQGGVNGSSKIRVLVGGSNPTPPIQVGQEYDFTSLKPESNSEIPKANIELSGPVSPSSGFVIPDNVTPQPTKNVTLESIDEGEKVTSSNPEFFGSGPPGESIEIKVESDPQTGQFKIGKNGKWNWDPPKDLPEGEHKITISWRDSQGILRTLSRTFFVQASEGPAFQASPSASLTPSPASVPTTPTPKSTPSLQPTFSPTPEATISASSPPTPESGDLTPTLILSSIGIGLVATSFLLWKELKT